MDRRLSIDLIANLGSLAFLAIAGIALNIIIARYFGPAGLGLFNIVFALFIFASQLGSAGVQYSTLHLTSLYKENGDEQLIFSSAISIVAVSSTATAVVAALASPLAGLIFDVDGIERGLLISLPGLWCFSINKVLLSFINGRGSLRAFAFFQSCRYLLMVAALILIMLIGIDPHSLPVLLTLSEATLLVLLTIHLRSHFREALKPSTNGAAWRIRQLRFGMLAMPSGVIAELNTRVDILLLGAFLGGFQTGIYSIAILFAEGYGQVVFVVRNVVNPLLGPIVNQRDQAALSLLVRNIGGVTMLIMIVGGTVLIGLFPFIDEYLLMGRFEYAGIPLAILVAGIGVTGPFMVFSMILSQGGKPGYFTMLMIVIFILNISFNIIGVLTLGMVGAAIGTSLSYIAGAVLLMVFTYRLFGLLLSP